MSPDGGDGSYLLLKIVAQGLPMISYIRSGSYLARLPGV
jgi:hypothetical protein